MARLCSGVFLLLVTASIGSALDWNLLQVHLKPAANITVCEGDSIQINCTWNEMQGKVSWHFNSTYKNCESKKIGENSPFFVQQNNSTLSTFENSSVKITDSGWYFCKVTFDIPVLRTKCSDGLYILVEPNSTQDPTQTPTQNQTTTNSPTVCSPRDEPTKPTIENWWIWIWVAVAVGCVVLIIIVVAICLLSCKTKEAIYENTALQKSSCWRQDRSRKDACNVPPSKKVETIKPLRKYDTLSENRYHRP
nr:uncharacterized protein LOC129453532 [Misgurnus anguillicaudatus]XP_055073782.1 uncharacterized protein LOC129453532 [Misgurnus anguillicaudatus]